MVYVYFDVLTDVKLLTQNWSATILYIGYSETIKFIFTFKDNVQNTV